VTQNAISYSLPPVIVYDPALFERFWDEWHSELPTMLIVAHEWGHQVQYANNVQYSTTFEYEQDADARAGYYMGTRAQRDGSANVEDVGRLLKEFACTTGDPTACRGSRRARTALRAAGERGHLGVQSGRTVRHRGGTRRTVAPETRPRPPGGMPASCALRSTVVDEDGITVGQEAEPFDYEVTIGDDGKVTDEQGYGR